MLLDIVPNKNIIENCFDNNIVSVIASHWNKDITSYHLCDFNLELIFCDVNNVLSKVRTSFSNSMSMLQNCTGIMITYHNINTDNVINHNFIYKELRENRPVGVMTDSFFCPWNKHSGILHENHFFIIVGCDKPNSNLYVVDGYLSDKIHSVSESYLYSIAKSLISFKNKDNWVYSHNYIVNEFFKCFNNNSLVNRADTIYRFSFIIETCDFFEQVREMKKLNSSKIVSHITDITNSRKNFISSLLISKDMFSISDNIIDKLNAIVKKWEIIKNTLLKSIVLENEKLFTKGGRGIYELADEECEAIDMFIDMQGH